MSTAEWNIDLQKHICYSEEAKDVVLRRLHANFQPAEAAQNYEKIRQKYAEYLADLPYLGGKKCTHNGTGGTYDCIFFCAYYEALGRKPQINEIYEMNNELFLPSFRRLGRFVDLNYPFWQRLLSLAFHAVARQDRKLLRAGTSGYDMTAEPYNRAIGVRYRFDRCPIAEFAKRHDLTELMPAFCNGDYPAIELLHGRLIRSSTCANGAVCDYRIVGSKAEALPLQKVDASGYFYN